MFKEAQLYAPVTTSADGTVHRRARRGPPRLCRPGLPRAPQPHRLAGRRLGARPARAARASTPRPSRASGGPCAASWRVKHERLACAEYREAMARLALPTDHIPQLDEVTARLAPLTGFGYHPAAGLVALRGVLRLAGRRHLSLHPVRPPPRQAALHARARPHPRGHRARRDAGQPAPGRAQPAGRARRPAPGDAGGAQVLRHRVLVLDRVRRAAGGAASCGPTGPGCSPPTARSTSSAAPTCARWTSPPWGPDLRHHPLPADPVRRRRDRAAAGRGGRLLRRRVTTTRPRGWACERRCRPSGRWGRPYRRRVGHRGAGVWGAPASRASGDDARRGPGCLGRPGRPIAL